MANNPFEDPFTNPMSDTVGSRTLSPAVPRRVIPSMEEQIEEPAFRQESLPTVADDTEDDVPEVPAFQSPYAGMDLVSEPMKGKEPTAFQKKEINWADGGEDLSRPRLRDVAPKDWLEVDYMFGKKEGATDAPVEAANVFGRQFTRDELMQDEDGRKLLDLMQFRRSGKLNEGGALANFGKGFTDVSVSDIPYYGWFADIGTTVGDAIEMSRTIRKLQDGEKVSNNEAIRLRSYMLRQELEGQRTTAYQVGSTVKSSVTLGTEMLASSAIGAGIGAMFGGVVAPVGAVVGAVLAPLRWVFGIGGAATKAGARKVVNVGMKALAEKATKDLTAAELKAITKAGVETFGLEGMATMLREGAKRGLSRRGVYQAAAKELQYATKMSDPSRMATRALFSADYRLALEDGLRTAIEEKALGKMLTNATKDAVAGLSARERRKLVNQGIRKMIEAGEWKPFVNEFSKGVMMGDKLTANAFVRKGVAEATGRDFVAPQYAQKMLDIVAGNVAKDMEIWAGSKAFAVPTQLFRYFGEHAARGLVQSEHALFGGAPTIAHNGFTTFRKGSDALKEGIGRVFIEAPIQGTLQFIGGPLALSPIFAAASGKSPTDITVKGQLGMEIDALMRGDRDKMETARMCALGSAFVEYASESAGRGLGAMTGGAVATVLGKSPRAVSEGAKAMVAPISRSTGAALDRAVKAVFGEGDLMKNGAEGFVNQTLRQIRALTGRSGVKVSVLRAVQQKSLDGFDEATRQAFAKKGVTTWKGLEKFIATEAAAGNRVKGALNYFGLKLMERGMTPDKVVQFFRQAGYNGIIEELGEERVGDFMRGLFGFDDTSSDATWKDKLQSMFSGFTDFDQLGTELIAFAIPGAIRRGTIAAQSWLANGAVSQARGAVQGLKYMTNPGQGRVYAAVGGVTQEDKERFERHPEESAKMRDGILGTTEENRAKILANAGAAYEGRAQLKANIQAAGGLKGDTVAEKADRGIFEGAVSQVLGVESEGHMKTAMNELADQYLACDSEDTLETMMEQTGAKAIFGDTGVDAIRKEWRKVSGHEFSSASAIEQSLSVPVNGNATSWKEFDAQKLTVTRPSADTPSAAVDDMCAQIAGMKRNASVSGEQEETANGESGALVADENARDVAVEDGMTLGRFLGRGAIRANAKMSFGRRCVSRMVGLLGAASTGDLSLAARSPAAWLADDEGIDKNLQMALLKCYSAGIMSGWARKVREQGDAIKNLVGEATTAEELRGKLETLLKEGKITEGLYDELETLGEETYRARVTEFMTAYMTASGVALVTRQDSLDMARNIVAKRHEKRGEKFDRNDEWFAQDAVAREVEQVRSDVIDGVIATARNSIGYTTHAGQGMYGTYMTVDVAQAIKNGTSAEILAAILDSPAFRGVSRVQNVSGLSEHDRELANSMMTSDVADLGAIAAIQTEGTVQADRTTADRELTERELTEINAVMKVNASDYTPEAFQNLARTFVRRVKLVRENMRSTFSKTDADGKRVTVRIAPVVSGGFDLVQTTEGSDAAVRTHVALDRAGVENDLAAQGFTMEEQKLVISQLRSFASSDATSLLFMRYGQDREAVRDLFKNSAGVIEDENMLPPYCRKEQKEKDGPLVWKYSDSESDLAAEAFRNELALADEYDRNRNSWQYYLSGTGATEAQRKARMQEAKKMYLRVYGVAEGEVASGGYESRARDTVESLGIRRSISTGTDVQQLGLPANAYIMNVDAMSAENTLVLAPDYFTLGHGEAMLRHGIRQALNVYVAGDTEEASLRADLLVEAYREFREAALEMVAEAEGKPGGHAEAVRLKKVFDEMLPVRPSGVTTQDLAKMASSALFFSCDRGNYEDGNGFLHSTELSQVADRFRAKDIFPFFLSAVDEALGGTGIFNVNLNNAGGLARYRQAFAPDFAKLAKARESAAFGGESGVVKLPFICGFGLREGIGADEFKNNPDGKWVVRDAAVGSKEETSQLYRVSSFDGKIAGYWGAVVSSGQRFARAYEGLMGGKDTVLSTTQAFAMARRADFCGGDTATSATGGETRARMSDVVSKLARAEVSRLTELPDVGDINPKSLEGAGQAFRTLAANLAMIGGKPATEDEAKEREAAYLKEFKGWLLNRNVPYNVAGSIIRAFDDAITRPIRRKTDEEAKNDAADKANAEATEAERSESTNDPDHEVRVAAFVNDQDIVAIAGILKFLMPSERGDSSPSFCRLRFDLARPEMYGEFTGKYRDWENDVTAFVRMLQTNFNVTDIDRTLAANKVNLGNRADIDRMLDRVSALLWKEGHKDYALAVAAIRNVDPANGVRGKMLEMLAQISPITPMFLRRTDVNADFDIDFIGSQTRAHAVPSVVEAGYTTLSESVLSGMFRKDGSLKKTEDAAAALSAAVGEIRSGAFLAKFGHMIDGSGLSTKGKWIGHGVDRDVADVTVDAKAYETIREVALGTRRHTLDEYVNAINMVVETVRQRMSAAADALDSVVGAGNQYSHMLRSPYALDALSRQALAAYNMRTNNAQERNARAKVVNDFMCMANYFIADSEAKGKSSWKSNVQKHSGFIEDTVVEPVMGLVWRLGVYPYGKTEDVAKQIAEKLADRDANWVRDTLRQMAKDKLRTDMHLDLGVDARNAYKNLSNNATFVPGATRTDGNLRVLIGAYLAGSPRSSSTLGGRSANAAEGSKQKAVQTLPSNLPGFIRFACSELCSVSGASAELSTNGYHWKDGSSPVVSFVGARDVAGRLLRKESLAGVLNSAIQAKLADPNYSMTHVLVPFFRADKPSCYALRIPIQTMRDMIVKSVGNEEIMRSFPKDLVEVVNSVATMLSSESETVINVWYGSGENQAFSNLALRPFVDKDGRRYESVEHAYQTLKSGKFNEDVYSDPGWKKAGYTNKSGPKANTSTNLSLMRRLVLASFRQNPAAANALIATGTAPFSHTQDKGVWKTEFPKALDSARRTLSNEMFYKAAYALAASALGQSQIDPKRVPVLASVGPIISTYVDEGDATDPRAGCYFISNIGGVTGASMMGGYITAGVLPSRVSGMGEGKWSQAQKLHMFSIKRGVNFKKGQASAIGLGFYADGRSDDRSSKGEIVSNHAIKYAQACGRRELEHLLSADFKAANLSGSKLLEPVAPLKENPTDEDKAKYEEACRTHDKAVDIANAFLKKATVAVDDLETNKAGLFGSSCGIALPKDADAFALNGVTIMRKTDGKWESAVDGFRFDFDGEGIKKGKVLVAPALAALAYATDGSVNASTVEAEWVRPDGSRFVGTLGASGLLNEGEKLSFKADKNTGAVQMRFFTREIYGQVVANNANSSKATSHHVFPTNATRDHWMMEELTNAMEGGRNGSRRFMDAHAGYSLLQLANLAHNSFILGRELRRDTELADLFAKHPNDNQVRDAISNRVRAFYEKQTLVGFYGNHGVMVPSGAKLVEGDEFSHKVRIEWAPGMTDYDKDCYKPATVFTEEEAAAFGTSRSWASGAVNADVDGFRYGLYFDEAALDNLLKGIDVDRTSAAWLAFEAAGIEAETIDRMVRLQNYVSGLVGKGRTDEDPTVYATRVNNLLACAYDYTGKKASANARKDIRFDDLLYRTADGRTAFDFAAIDFKGRTSLHDGQKHLYLGGSIFHAHRSPSGNIAAACGTVRATCPVSYFADGRIGAESKYALDPVTTATQGSDMDGDSASLQFYDYGAEDLVDETTMRRFTDAVLSGEDPFVAAEAMRWTMFVDGAEVINPRVLASVSRLVFLAQCSNYREAVTFHQGYCSVPGLKADGAKGHVFAKHYRDNVLDEGWEFADYGFAGRHPVGTDAVFGEPFTAESLSRFRTMLNAKLGTGFEKEWFVEGKPMNKVLEAAVDAIRGEAVMKLLDPASSANSSDAASDSAKARGISVANQSMFLRALVTKLDASNVVAWNADGKYSPAIDLIAHFDGISNNLFDTLKKMFATRAGWTTSMLPFFLGRLVVKSRTAVGGRLDSAFVLAEAVNFLEELTRTTTDGKTATLTGRLSTLLDPVKGTKVAIGLVELYNKGVGEEDRIRLSRNRAGAVTDSADSIIDKFVRATVSEEESFEMNRDEKAIYAAQYMCDEAHRPDDGNYDLYLLIADAADESKDLCAAIDYMKVSGKGLRDIGRYATARTEALAERRENARHPATRPTIDRDPSARLQDLVVSQFATQVAGFLDSSELLQYAIDGQIGRRPWDFASGSALRENYDRFVHLIGAVHNIDRAVVTTLATGRITKDAVVIGGQTVTPAVDREDVSTERLLRRIAATVRFYADSAASWAAPANANPAAVQRMRLLSSLEVAPNGVAISLGARESSSEIEDLRAGFESLAAVGERKFSVMEMQDGKCVDTGLRISGTEFANLLVLHASLTGTFGAAQDYVTQSNLPSVFGDARLAKLEDYRPVILSSPEVTSALGLAPIDVGGTDAYDLFGTAKVYDIISAQEARDNELAYIRGLYETATDKKEKDRIRKRGLKLKEKIGKYENADPDRRSAMLFQSMREVPAYDILGRAETYRPAYARGNDARDVRVGTVRAGWTDSRVDQIAGLMIPDGEVGSATVEDFGLRVTENPVKVGAHRVDPSWADPLTTCTEFVRPGETEPAYVFACPLIDVKGEISDTDFKMLPSLEMAVNYYLYGLAESGKTVPSRIEAKSSFSDLNPTKKFLTYDAGRVSRDIASIIGESLRRDADLYDAFDSIGDRLVRHPDPRVAAAINLVNSRLGQEGPKGIMRPTEAQTRASFMGGKVDTSARTEFIDRAEAIRPGFTALQSRSVREAVKGAFESAFADTVVTNVLDRDGNETNLMKVERTVSGRKIVTYVSYGSRMGETLSAKAAADSIAEVLNARAKKPHMTASMKALFDKYDGDVDSIHMEAMADGTVLDFGSYTVRFEEEMGEDGMEGRWVVRYPNSDRTGEMDDSGVLNAITEAAFGGAKTTGEDVLRRLGAGAVTRLADLMRRTGGQTGESVVGGLDFAPAMSGIIRLSESANFTTLFHEYYHQMVAVYRKLGILTKETETQLNAELGGEERAAELFGRYLTGVENGATDVELREFLKEDGVTDAHIAVFHRFRKYATEFARGSFRGVDSDGVPQFVAVKIIDGNLTEDEARKIVQPSKADVANVENEILGLETRPRLDVLTADQMIAAQETVTKALHMVSLGGDANDRQVGHMLWQFEQSLAPKAKVQTKAPADVALSEPAKRTAPVEDMDVAKVSAFIRKALTRYSKDGRIEGFDESMRLYREFAVTKAAASGPNAALFYTVRSFIAHVAEAEGVSLYREDGSLTDAGEKLMSSDVVGELAMRFVNNASADRAENGSARSSAEFASGAWAFSRALQTVAPGAYTRYCKHLANKCAETFRRLGDSILARKDKTARDVETANEFLAKSREVGKFIDYIVRGQDIRGLLPFKTDAGGNLHGMFMTYFAGSAQFRTTKATDEFGLEEDVYEYPAGPVRPYSRELTHTNALSTGDAAQDPLVDLAYNYAAQAFAVAEAARNYREQILGKGKDEARPEEDLAGDGTDDTQTRLPITEEETAAIEQGLAETLQTSQNPTGELANALEAEATQLDVNASKPMTEPAQFYSRVDTTLTSPEWILANAGQWLASDVQRNLAGVSFRDMMTDHTVRAVTEQQYRLAMDWVQFFGMDTHVGDGVRKVEFIESTLGRNAKGDFAISDDYAHTTMGFSKTNGALFGIFNWQEKRVGAPITEEDWREIHSVGRLVKLLANRQWLDLTGIEVGFLAAPLAVADLKRDDYRAYFSPEAILKRLSDSPGYKLTAVEDLLRRIVDDLPKSIVNGNESGESAENAQAPAAEGPSRTAEHGLYYTILDAIHRAVTSREAKKAGENSEKVNDLIVDALVKANVVHRAASRSVDRAVVCVSTNRMLKAWNESKAKQKLIGANRPAQMLNPYYWANRFSKAVGAINAAASKSSYLSMGEGTNFTLVGTNRFWWHGGTGSHQVQVNAYQNALKAFEGMTPSDVATLRATQAELFDIIEASNNPKTLQRRAVSDKGIPAVSDKELRYLAYMMGLTDRSESKFDVRSFARDIAAGKYETHGRDSDVPCTISREATVLDIRLTIGELVSNRTFGTELGSLTAEKRQEYLNAQTAADMLRETLTREVPGKITARSELEVFDRTGRLGDSRTAAESLIEMCKELTTAERFRGCLAQMLTSLSADGTPAFVVAPTDAALAVDRMPDEYWGALARHVVKFLGQRMPTLAYDAGLSGAENMRRIHRQLVEGDQKLYGKMSTAKYGGDRLFQGDVLCRLDDRDVAGNVDEATRLMGGEAACYMKQLLATLHAPTQSSAWRIMDTLSSWSKISSVGFSAFFQIATAFESPTAAVGFLKTLAGQAEWMGKAFRKLANSDDVFTRDIMRLLNTNDPFMTEARELCDLIGMPLDSTIDFMNDPNDSNPVLGNTAGIKRDIEKISALASRVGMGKAVRKTLEFMYKHPTDYTFNVVLNGVKMAVVMQTVRRLREECLKGGRPFDLVKEMRRYGSYINAEIGGLDPARYAWATPGMKKVLSLGMFSWQWTVGAWSAGGGEAISDILFGGHSTNAELRRHAMMRWIRMFGIVKFGVPAFLQAAIKALSFLGLKALPPDPDDPDDGLENDVDQMPWWTFNNESKAGMLAFDITPLLKLGARIPGAKALKRADIPVISWAVPAYVGGGRNTTGKRHYYMHFGKQSDEFWRWFERPMSQFVSKLSIPLQKGVEGFFGRLQPNGFSKGFADKSMIDRWFTLSLDPDQSALANFVFAMISSFSLESMKANADAGFVAAVGPMRMGQSKRSTMLRIAERLQELAEDDRTGNPWSSVRNRRKFNLMCTDILREAQLNGVDASEIVTAALGDVAHREYAKFFESFPKNLDGLPDVEGMQEAIRGLTRIDRKYKDIRSYIVQKFKASGTDLKANRAYYRAVCDAIRSTQYSPVAYGNDVAEDRFGRYLVRPDQSVRSTQMAAKGGEVFGNFLATDEVPETLFGVPVVTKEYTEEDLAFFEEHPEAGGYYDLGEGEGGIPPEPPTGGPTRGALKAKPARRYVTLPSGSFSSLFESKPVAVKGKDGKTYYKPTRDKAGKYDIGGYRSYWSATQGKLVAHSNDGLLPEKAYLDGKKRLDAYFNDVTNKVYAKHGVDAKTLGKGLDTAARDIVFNTGGDDFLNASPKFAKIVSDLKAKGMKPNDAFGVALALEQDSYGWQNDRRFAARGGTVMDSLSASADPTVRRFADAYRTGWDSAADLHASAGDAYGTNWERHKAGMREASKVADALGLEYSARGNK